MRRNSTTILAVAAATLQFLSPAWAEDEQDEEAETFIITGSPLEQTAAETAATVTTVKREEILQSGAASLGDLLANEAGIHQSSFASGASRPIIRGLDNFRVRVQENGVGSHDASALSEDHGVPIDPFSATQIEVVRGPAVLRYGSEAIGGVVNVINNRIPTYVPETGLSAEGFSMISSADNGWQVGGLVDFGTNQFAGHIDAFFRHSDDYDIPEVPGTQAQTRLEQSGASLGGSVLLDRGHVGGSISFFQSEYDIPAAEADLFIEMEQVRIQVGGDLDELSAAFPRATFSIGFSDYTHDEIQEESGQVSSTFNNEEIEGRVELTHAAVPSPLGEITGAVGFQARARDLTASGEGGELLAPSETRALGAFLFEEVPLVEQATLQLAARVEHVEVDGTGFLPQGSQGTEFAASRDFTPLGASAGVVVDLGNDLYLSGTAQSVQRAPDVLELFAKGPHESTETFELGDPDLSVETARSLEATLEQTHGSIRFEIAVFHTQFEDFIFKNFTGIQCGGEFDTCGVEDGLNQIVYTQEDATFTGFEASAEVDLLPLGDGILTLDLMADHVRAELDAGGNVPRIPPFRYGAGLTYEDDRFTAHAGFTHVDEQDNLAAFETPTGAYTRIDAELSYRFNMPNTETPFEIGIAANNLTDEAIRNHTSFKKDDVLLPGRNIRLFVRARF